MIEGLSLITPGRLENLRNALRSVKHLPGEIAELGVYKGGSAVGLASECPEKCLHLFDTFRGLPTDESAVRDPGGYVRAGMHSCSASEVRAQLNGWQVVFHEGLFPETAVGLGDMRWCFVHVDCDLYTSARDAIAFFWPRLTPGGVMFFDDYGCLFTGVTEAVHEAFGRDAIEKQIEPGNGIPIGCLVRKRDVHRGTQEPGDDTDNDDATGARELREYGGR